MPVESSWGNPQKSIVVVTLRGAWTLDEYHSMIDTVQTMMSTVNHTVHVISDFTHSSASPAKLLTAGRHMETTSSDKVGVISVAVNAGGFVKAMSSVVQKMFLRNLQMYFADSLEEAYQIVEKHQNAASNHTG